MVLTASRLEYGYDWAQRYCALHWNMDVPITYVDEIEFIPERWGVHGNKKADGITIIKLAPEQRQQTTVMDMV